MNVTPTGWSEVATQLLTYTLFYIQDTADSPYKTSRMFRYITLKPKKSPANLLKLCHTTLSVFVTQVQLLTPCNGKQKKNNCGIL